MTLVKYLTLNQYVLDSLDSRLIPLLRIIKGCKTIPEVDFAIRSPAYKMAAKIHKTDIPGRRIQGGGGWGHVPLPDNWTVHWLRGF